MVVQISVGHDTILTGCTVAEPPPAQAGGRSEGEEAPSSSEDSQSGPEDDLPTDGPAAEERANDRTPGPSSSDEALESQHPYAGIPAATREVMEERFLEQVTEGVPLEYLTEEQTDNFVSMANRAVEKGMRIVHELLARCEERDFTREQAIVLLDWSIRTHRLAAKDRSGGPGLVHGGTQSAADLIMNAFDRRVERERVRGGLMEQMREERDE